jgi:hypothetical protein
LPSFQILSPVRSCICLFVCFSVCFPSLRNVDALVRTPFCRCLHVFVYIISSNYETIGRFWRNLLRINTFERRLCVVRVSYFGLLTGTWRTRELAKLERHFIWGRETMRACLWKTRDFLSG